MEPAMNALTHDLRLAARTANRPAPLRRSRLGAILDPLVAAARAICRWWAERRDAARLSSYPDAMLKDIGLSRGGIDWAVRHGHREEPAENAPERPRKIS
jgi:uncharacterized protein YjiS (DUF1127 family)